MEASQAGRMENNVKIGRFVPTQPQSNSQPQVNDIAMQMNDIFFSNRHCSIYYVKQEKAWYLRDDGSLNGTCLRIFDNSPLVLAENQVIDCSN